MPMRDYVLNPRSTQFTGSAPARINYQIFPMQGNWIKSVINIKTGSPNMSMTINIYGYDHLAHLALTGSGALITHTTVTSALTSGSGFQEEKTYTNQTGSPGAITPFLEVQYAVSGSGNFTGSHLIIDGTY